VNQPTEGGRYTRDPATKKLTKVTEKPAASKPKPAVDGEKGK
jgi:hypothetical protein